MSHLGKAEFQIGSRDRETHLNPVEEFFRESPRRSKTDSESSELTIVDRQEFLNFAIIDSGTLMRDPEEVLECQSISENQTISEIQSIYPIQSISEFPSISVNIDIEEDWSSESEVIL